MESWVLRVIAPDSPRFAECMAILRQSIPRGEQLPTDRMRNLLGGESYQLLSFGTGEEAQAVAIVCFSSASFFCLLDYMAVRPDLRGQGVGSALFRAVVELAQRRHCMLDWLLLEVDDDRPGSTELRAVNSRRIEFYRRLGARLLENVPYRFPSAFVGPVPMRLMAYAVRLGATLSADDLRRSIADVFWNVHGRNNEDDVLKWFEDNLPDEIEMK